MFTDPRVVIIGGTQREAPSVEFLQSVCEDAGWETRWIRCPGYRLPSSFHYPNYLDGSWRIIVLKELRGGQSGGLLSAAAEKGVPAEQIEDYSPDSIRQVLDLLTRPLEQPPIGYVVAQKIVNKLKAQNKWGGKHSYLWLDDLPQGGFDSASEQPFVLAVADVLVREGLLLLKTKKGGQKVALNSDRRSELEQIANGGIRNPQLRDKLGPDRIGY